jgi:hypothetical protein
MTPTSATPSDTSSRTCERIGHDWMDRIILNDATRVVSRPCKRCRTLQPVGCLCMVGGCDGWPTKRIVKLGGLFMCQTHAQMLGQRYTILDWHGRPTRR